MTMASNSRICLLFLMSMTMHASGFRHKNAANRSASRIQFDVESSRRRRISQATLDKLEKTNEMVTGISERVMNVMENVLSVDYCWRGTQRRAERLADCSADKTPTTLGGMRCWNKCPQGTTRKGDWCEKSCPAGSTRAPVLLRCNTPGHSYARPRLGFARRGACKSGYQTLPLRCVRPATWTAVERVWSPSEVKNACRHASYPDGPFTTAFGKRCFQRAPENYVCDRGAPAICWAKCPPLMQVCGLGLSCGSSTAACAANIAEMSISVVLAAAETALLISTWGASTGSGAAARVGIKASVRQALKKGAKENLKNFQKKLTSKLTRKAIKDAVKKKVTKDLAKDFAKEFGLEKLKEASDLAVSAFINKFLADNENVIEAESFEAFDPTGLSTAIRTTIEKDSAVETSKAWVEVVGALDPTGWISAAASFMNPKCEEWAE